ncbi:Transcription initiation factor iif subunit [Pleurostoma richardsiae]|uniref:Transcription initiation factor iif subunit n=1 Tax=Pleurostoma richardsiae TaxID=41990 RepID=A0AA38VFX9_9PEZI|nr:Transcription initiation factor iif subunit [Pleurostoma richardsiae]
MSGVPPPGMPNGHGHHPPPTGAAPLRRKARAADPLVARKKPIPKPQRPPQRPANSNALPKPTGPRPLLDRQNPVEASPPIIDPKTLEEFKARRRRNDGWWDPKPAEGSGLICHEYPLIITKRSLKEGLRFHVMRFAKSRTGDVVDPTDQNEFARPVTLNRRDPRSLAVGRAIKEPSPSPTPVDDAEAERLAKAKAERDAQRAIDQAQIAPVARDQNQNRQAKKPEKPTAQTYYPKRTEEQKKESALRYEESLPWVLEDAEGKEVWLSSYQAALSGMNVAFVVDGGQFRMIPLEKYYKFTQKPPFKTFSLDEAEKMMNKKVSAGRWVMRDQEKEKMEEDYNATRQLLHGPTRVKMESSTFRAASRSEKQEHDDIDMSGDEFQDDDENPSFEPDNDEEVKESRERVRRDMLGANLFGEADEKEVVKEEEDEKAEELARKLFGKELRRALAKREKHMEYKSDSDDEDPFASSSSEDETDKEKQDTKKEDEAKSKDQKSGAGSKGTNTPSSKQKGLEAAQKGKLLKRPGSPNLSESSEAESSRKKAKKHGIGSSRPSRSTTPMPGQQRSKTGAGAASDGEATGGEMSDGGRIKKKIKLVGTGARGTPTGSRAGSPAPTQGQLSPTNIGSPARTGTSTPRPGSPNASGSAGGSGGPVQPSEIVAALAANPQGISVGQLLKLFNGRVGDNPNQMSRRDWIKLVKENAKWGADKLLRPKDS